MILGIAEDLTSSVSLDSELKSIPESGMYLNSGVHPSINLGNLLYFLPNIDFTFTDWDNGTTYGKYSDSRARTDLVTYNTKVYQSILGVNTNHLPDEEDSSYWIETNIESLRLKTFIFSVKDRVKSELKLTRRLVDNQYIYANDNQFTSTTTLPNDYAAWAFEPKGSDYTAFRINEISFRATTTDPVNLYVVNQNTLVDTLQITPNDGKLEFNQLDYSFSGKGKFYFVVDSTEVITNGRIIDSLNYDGFVVYTASGIGVSPGSADYSIGGLDNGLGFNITTYFDSAQYVTNNMVEFANYIRATFELMVFEMFLYNSNNRSNRSERIQMKDDLLIAETKELKAHSVIFKQREEKKRAIMQLDKSHDREVNDNDDDLIIINSTSI